MKEFYLFIISMPLSHEGTKKRMGPLKLSGKSLGLLANFNVSLLRTGTNKIIYTQATLVFLGIYFAFIIELFIK